MKLNKKFIVYVLLVSFILSDNTSIAVSKPSVTKELIIDVGNKKTIEVKGDFISSKSFKSTNKKIAKVNKNGVVTAKSIGKCTIKVTVKYRKSRKAKKIYIEQFLTTIRIQKAAQSQNTEVTTTPDLESEKVTNIVLSEKNLVLHENETASLSTTITPISVENEKLLWKSENEAVATVENNGEVTAIAVGMTTITVQCGTKQADCVIEVISSDLDVIATDINIKVHAVGKYQNWDGVSNVSQFIDENGKYCFAYDSENYVFIVKTENGLISGNSIRLEKVHSIFGGVTCDNRGNYYIVTGETNTGNDTNQDTIFISKYDMEGNLIKTVGDNGSSSVHYDSSFYTKIPLCYGSCDMAINGDILTVHYAREMYSGHQSDSVFTINTETLEKVDVGAIYQSHCFAQRVIPYKNGFIYAGEGDCYNRAFTITTVDDINGKNIENDIFHFWVEENTLNNWDMHTLNNNFAHMGGLAVADSINVAFVGTSVKALNAEAKNQNEQLFIQIFNPEEDLSSVSSYVTTGIRSGIGGPNGDEAVTDYGVKWLSDFDNNTYISNPQVVSDNNGTIVVLFEKSVNEYNGVYYIKLNADGTIQKDISCLSENARLNPCRMPVYFNGKIYWTANKYNDENNVYIYNFSI